MRKLYISSFEYFFRSVRNSFSYRLISLFLLLSQISFGQTALKLPFFEDFSSTKTTSPTDSLWVKGSGVQINNTFGINPPSFGVATFDGKNADGIPYNFTNKNASGYTDSLVSKPINLAGLTAKDSVYFSFFGQKGGLGEIPDNVEGDSLLVLFKDVNLKWQKVWPANVPDSLTNFKTKWEYDKNLLLTRQDSLNKTPATLNSFLALLKKDSLNYANSFAQYTKSTTFPTKAFSQQFIIINNTTYFHADFQFCIKAKGRKSGPFDVWNIDYIYLNSKRSPKKVYYPDLAWQQINSGLLKNYSSMPLKQFLANPAKELNDSLKATIYYGGYDLNTIKRGSSAFVRYKCFVKDSVGTILANPASGFPTQDFVDSTKKLAVKLPILSSIDGQRVRLETQFKVFDQNGSVDDPADKRNSQNFGIPLEKLAQNDAISSYTILDNYYAYDDGTAEASVDFETAIYGKVAVQFNLNKKDNIAAINVYFNPTIATAVGQTFSMQLYDNTKIKVGKDSVNVPGKIIAQAKATINASGAFQTFLLDSKAEIQDNGIFYVGWTKNSASSAVLPIGLDKNTPQFANKIFFSTTKDWINNTSQESASSMKGSIMIRPILGAFTGNATTNPATVITATEEEKLRALIVFPNPNEGILSWNLENIKQIKIYDVAGKEIFQKNIEINTNDNRQIDLRSLSMGTYFVNFSDGKKSYSKKIIIVK